MLNKLEEEELKNKLNNFSNIEYDIGNQSGQNSDSIVQLSNGKYVRTIIGENITVINISNLLCG